MAETKRQRLEKLRKQVKQERTKSWDTHYQDLSNFITPRGSRFLTTEYNDGKKKQQYIIDNTGTRAARTLRAGLHSGSTNPARPWFKLATPDPDLMEFTAVKEWLFYVERRMRDMFLRSNLYNALPVIYGHLGVFGTSACAFLEDPKDGMRFYPFPVGSYSLAQDERQQVDTIVRESAMTVRQIVTRFGDRTAGPKTRWNNFSRNLKSMWDNGNYEQTIDVVHSVLPNPQFDPTKLEAKFKPFQSTYYELGGDNDNKFLRESGFDEFPVMAPRWEVTGEDVYGSSPGMEALGDIKSLQKLHRQKSEANEKTIKPPMVGPSSLRNAKSSLISGDVTYIDVREGMQGFKPAYQVNFDTNGTLEDIRDHQQRIDETFYKDLFLMLAMTDRRQITAREISERHEEKLLMLGPVLEQMYGELHDPIVNRAFNIMLKRGEVPPPPKELEGIDLKIEYLSIMAQAQKAVATQAIDQFVGFVGRVAEAQAGLGMTPDIVDKVDLDQTVDEYGDYVGVPPHLIRSDDDVAGMRDERQQAIAAAQQQEQNAVAAQTAKTLSEASTEEDNALTNMIQGL